LFYLGEEESEEDSGKIFDFLYKNVQEVSPPNDLNLNNPNQFNLNQINLNQDSNTNQLNLNQNSPNAYEPGQVYYKPVEQVTNDKKISGADAIKIFTPSLGIP